MPRTSWRVTRTSYHNVEIKQGDGEWILIAQFANQHAAWNWTRVFANAEWMYKEDEPNSPRVNSRKWNAPREQKL